MFVKYITPSNEINTVQGQTDIEICADNACQLGMSGVGLFPFPPPNFASPLPK
jgi:hypothetical protein